MGGKRDGRSDTLMTDAERVRIESGMKKTKGEEERSAWKKREKRTMRFFLHM